MGNLQIFDTEVQNETEENEQLAEAIYTPIYTPKPIFDFFKRVFDVFASLICIVVGLPVYLIIAAVIIIDDPGNPFFAQERVGLNGKHYMCLKWRSMYMDAEARKAELAQQNEYDSVHFKMANDPRITKVGHLMKRRSF